MQLNIFKPKRLIYGVIIAQLCAGSVIPGVQCYLFASAWKASVSTCLVLGLFTSFWWMLWVFWRAESRLRTIDENENPISMAILNFDVLRWQASLMREYYYRMPVEQIYLCFSVLLAPLALVGMLLLRNSPQGVVFTIALYICACIGATGSFRRRRQSQSQ